MGSINCKMCGNPNSFFSNQKTVICDACGTEQTIPNIDEDKKLNMFNRANAARMKCDFDKAMTIYENILIDYQDDPEAHWGICLCKYGIEYVDDLLTNTKVPTCHRTLFDSILSDDNYLSAISNTDAVSRQMYEAEAIRIDNLQKKIISIAQNEEPYDIFICYKESDMGKRTRDSIVGEDIYKELTNKGYKVFFARITLENKLGLEYEPIIFSALQSSKIMLVIGSKTEYFESVWVKNEWKRFLLFMKNANPRKYLIPCFRDIEAYDLPMEFVSFQAQNLDKLGAKEDLLRGIDKIFGYNNQNKIPVNNMPINDAPVNNIPINNAPVNNQKPLEKKIPSEADIIPFEASPKDLQYLYREEEIINAYNIAVNTDYYLEAKNEYKETRNKIIAWVIASLFIWFLIFFAIKAYMDYSKLIDSYVKRKKELNEATINEYRLLNNVIDRKKRYINQQLGRLSDPINKNKIKLTIVRIASSGLVEGRFNKKDIVVCFDDIMDYLSAPETMVFYVNSGKYNINFNGNGLSNVSYEIFLNSDLTINVKVNSSGKIVVDYKYD